MKKQRYPRYLGLLAVSVTLAIGSASCDDTAVPSTPAAGGAEDGGAGGAPDAAGTGTGGAGGTAAGADGGAGGVAEPLRVRVSGSAQKGPIVAGSSVTVFGLDSTLESTGTSFPSQTEDNLGSFSVSANLTEELIEVVAQGPFYDELTGQLSETSIVLRALASASPNTDIRVNLLTTVSKDRIRYLVGQGQEFEDAVAQAEDEVLRAFGIEDDTLDAFTAMDLTGPSPSDAALIALSAILLQYAADHSSSEGEKVAKLSLAVSTLASDLKEDGVLNDTGLSVGLPTAAVRLDVASVTANLEEIYAGLGQSILAPDIQPFVDIVGAAAPWQYAPSLPGDRVAHCACAVDDKIYVIGGIDSKNVNPIDAVLEYDPATEQWQPKAKVPTARSSQACTVVNGIIYVSGGLTADGRYTDVVEAFDPAQDAWTTKAAMPLAQGSHASTTVNGKVYVMGGTDSHVLDSAFVYDPAQDTWESISPLPMALMAPAAAALSGKVYTFGGYRGASGHTAAVYEYDPVADTWSPRASMRTARAGTAVALGEHIYVIGGESGTTALATVEQYDPPADTWATKTSMNLARGSAPGVVSSDLAYVIGGVVTQSEPTYSPIVETYDPTKDE